MFADVVIQLLTSDATLDLLDAPRESGQAAPQPGATITAFWGRYDAALKVIRGIASRLPDGGAKDPVLRDIESLDSTLRRVRTSVREAATAVSELESGLTSLRGSVAAIPNDELRTALAHELDSSLKPLHALGNEILILQRAAHTISLLAESSIKTALSAFINQAGEDLGHFKRSIATWYNDVMDHASGWYKRKTQLVLVGIALFLCVVNNVDTIALVGHLSTSPELRASADQAAMKFLAGPGASTEGTARSPIPAAAQSTRQATPEELERALESSNLPLWWSRSRWNELFAENAASVVLLKILGLLLSTMAVSMGAPFWFDVLNKLVNVRLVGKRPEPTVKSMLTASPERGRTGGSQGLTGTPE
jgi:hypothetical protein